MADSGPKEELSKYSPEQNSGDASNQPLSSKVVSGSEVRGQVDSNGGHVVKGQVDPNKSYGENYPPGKYHVPHQDDWLNPDMSKLPPPVSPPPVGTHIITPEEARGLPTALSGALTAAAPIAPSPWGYAAGVGAWALATDTAKDIADKALSGRTFPVLDPVQGHLDNQKKGITD